MQHTVCTLKPAKHTNVITSDEHEAYSKASVLDFVLKEDTRQGQTPIIIKNLLKITLKLKEIFIII